MTILGNGLALLLNDSDGPFFSGFAGVFVGDGDVVLAGGEIFTRDGGFEFGTGQASDFRGLHLSDLDRWAGLKIRASDGYRKSARSFSLEAARLNFGNGRF